MNQADGPESNQLCGHAIKQLNLGRRFHELLRNLEPASTSISFADQNWWKRLWRAERLLKSLTALQPPFQTLGPPLSGHWVINCCQQLADESVCC